MLDRLHRFFEHERRFVADASHEVRTPIAVIKTELEAARRGEGLVDRIVEVGANAHIDERAGRRDHHEHRHGEGDGEPQPDRQAAHAPPSSRSR